jgi:hypothetical protein
VVVLVVARVIIYMGIVRLERVGWMRADGKWLGWKGRKRMESGHCADH